MRPLNYHLEGTPVGELFVMAGKEAKLSKAERATLKARRDAVRRMRKERGFPARKPKSR